MTDPVALHAALLSAIKDFKVTCACANTGAHRALLRAVVELHRPRDTYPSGGSTGRPLCFGCDMGPYPDDHADWPCSTVAVIAEGLGVDFDD